MTSRVEIVVSIGHFFRLGRLDTLFLGQIGYT
jgi:hypothetical protein